MRVAPANASKRDPTSILITALAVGNLALSFVAAKPAPKSNAVSGKAAPGRQTRSQSRPGSSKASASGHDAETPAEIPARGWWAIAKRVFANISEHRLMTEAAGITFYALLALFPALAALVSIYGLFADPATISDQLASLSGVLPGGGMQIITDQLKSLTATPNKALGFAAIIGLATSLWSANQGTKALFDALNVVYAEKEKRGFLRRTAITLGCTLGGIMFVLLAMVAVVVVPIIFKFVGLGELTNLLVAVLRWPLLLVGLAALLAVIYRVGPSRESAQWRWVSWGGGFAAVVWVLGSLAFSYYVSNFGSYDKTYGSLGAAIGFMTWIWLSATIVLIGAEVNAEMEHQTEHDTTTGPEQPTGGRGATKADQVAPA